MENNQRGPSMLQGSVLSPILFLMHTAYVIEITTHHGLSAHSHADDTQLKVHKKAHQCLKRLHH